MMNRKLATRVIASFACALALLIAAAEAPAQDADTPRGERQQESRLIERFLDLATTELNLNVEQRKVLAGILEETSRRRRELGRAETQLRRELRRALSDAATEPATFEQLLDRRFELQERGLQLQRWQRERIAQALTPRQTLRFMLMQERLAQRIRAMRGNRP